jgi:hypothetical protein
MHTSIYHCFAVISHINLLALPSPKAFVVSTAIGVISLSWLRSASSSSPSSSRKKTSCDSRQGAFKPGLPGLAGWEALPLASNPGFPGLAALYDALPFAFTYHHLNGLVLSFLLFLSMLVTGEVIALTPHHSWFDF